jgi:hypothetical protein
MGEWIYIYIYRLLTSALVEGEWSLLLLPPATLPPRKEPCIMEWIGGWVGPRAGLNNMENCQFFILTGLELRLLNRPSRNQSALSRLYFQTSY